MNRGETAYTRREFLGSGLFLASAALAVPGFVQSSARAMAGAMGGLSSAPGVPDDHVLVVIQLSGGNDGLNTVIPFGTPEYYRARPGISVAEKDVLKLSNADGLGLHPALAGLRGLYDEGQVAIVQGVGYPNPNRSHFKSMDIWHAADLNANGDGWLGKYFDSECCGFGKGESGAAEGAGGPAGIAIGRTAPHAMQGRSSRAVSFESADLFRWSGQDISKELAARYDELNRRESGGDSSNADFLTRTALDAQVSSDLIRKAVAQRSGVNYPGNELGNQLRMVASMIKAGLRTRVYYVSLGSFDTHAGQGANQGRHANLLRSWSDSVRAFTTDLKQQGNADRVLTMTFSEFGRRVSQNASAGTDHGTAAPMFLTGPMVKPGVHAEHPSLKDLDEGDLRHKVDFRGVYASVLDHWMGAKSQDILGARFEPTAVIKV